MLKFIINIDLFKLILKSRYALSNVDVPILVVHTMNDELVSHKSLNLFKKNLKHDNKIIQLKNSGHFYYDKKDLDCLCNELIVFLDGIKNLQFN